MRDMKTKEYIQPIPALWWLHNRYLVMFMIRELTSVFVAGYAVFLLVLIYKAGQGKKEFAEFYAQTLESGWSIALQVIAMAFVIYHSATWFNLTPKVMVVWRGEEKVSPVLIAGANYVLWLIVSVLILYLVI